MNPRTEKAIQKWLDLPEERRYGFVYPDTVELVTWSKDSPSVSIARFTLKSLIKKRYPAKKKAVRRTK